MSLAVIEKASLRINYNLITHFIVLGPLIGFCRLVIVFIEDHRA